MPIDWQMAVGHDFPVTHDVEAWQPDPHQELLRVFKNSEQDIDANRIGQLGEGQSRRLQRSATGALIAMSVMIAVLFTVVILIGGHHPQSWRWIIVILAAAGFAAIGINQHKGLRRAVRDGTVECLEGQVRIRSRARNGWWLTIEGREFRLPVQVWLLGADAEYRVYIATAAKRIVGMETPGAPPDLADPGAVPAP